METLTKLMKTISDLSNFFVSISVDAHLLTISVIIPIPQQEKTRQKRENRGNRWTGGSTKGPTN